MAELTGGACCAPPEQAACCEPEAKPDCCRREPGCACEAGDAPTRDVQRPGTRRIRDRAGAAVIHARRRDAP